MVRERLDDIDLGQYAVVWREGRAVCIGPDAPDVEPHGALRTVDTGTSDK